jgi:hypothetical protein
VLGFGFFGIAVLLVAPPVGMIALGLAALPLASVFFLGISRVAEQAPTIPGGPVQPGGAMTRARLEPALLTALDLAAPMAGPGPRGPWMPVDVTSEHPVAIRPLQADGSPLPLLAEAGVVLAGPLPRQAVRHMIAAYPPEVAGLALAAGHGNHLGAFGAPVAAMERIPDLLPAGEVGTSLRVVAADGTVTKVAIWRRGTLVAHVAVSGDETLAPVVLGHAVAVADQRLAWLAAAV